MGDSIVYLSKQKGSLPSSSQCSKLAIENAKLEKIENVDKKHSKELGALSKINDLVSQDLELNEENLRDLRRNLHILSKLTILDGITAKEKIILSTLEEELTCCKELIHKGAKGIKEVELKKKEFGKKLKEVTVIKEQCEKVGKTLRNLNRESERIEAEDTDAKRTEEKIKNNLIQIDESLNKCSKEIKKLEDADLQKQKSEVEDLEHDEWHRKDEMKKFIRGLLDKFSSLSSKS